MEVWGNWDMPITKFIQAWTVQKDISPRQRLQKVAGWLQALGKGGPPTRGRVVRLKKSLDPNPKTSSRHCVTEDVLKKGLEDFLESSNPETMETNKNGPSPKFQVYPKQCGNNAAQPSHLSHWEIGALGVHKNIFSFMTKNGEKNRHTWL